MPRRNTSAAVLLLILAAAPALAVRVEIVLDASGSMQAAAGSRTRMEAAREAVKSAVAAIPADSTVGLRLYGHRVHKDDREASCRDTELVIPFGSLDRQRFASVVDAAEPRGQTPLAYSLEQAAGDLSGDEQGVIVLVSDGEESCGGDPRAVACRLAAQGLPLTVHTVGFDVDAATRRQLEAIAACTGGEYRDARDAAALAGSLEDLVQASLVLDKERQVAGAEVRGGDGFDSAVPLEAGAVYRLDHHLERDQEDYFAIDLQAGQKLVASVHSHEVGISVSGGRAREDSHQSCAGIAVHGPDRQRIVSRWGHRPGQRTAVEVPLGAGQGGRFYVLVGPLGCPGAQHNDSRFQLAVLDLFDAGGGTDAGESRQQALPIAAGEHRGWLHANDGSDFYRFDTVGGASYDVVVAPEQQRKHLEVKVYDRDGRQVATAGHGLREPGATLRLEGLRMPAGGGYVEVARHPIGRHESGTLESAYALTVAEALPQAAQHADTSTQSPVATDAPVDASLAASGVGTGGIDDATRDDEPRGAVRLVARALWSGVPFVVGMLLGALGGWLLGRGQR